jgi:Flp pilus assembly protein TadB
MTGPVFALVLGMLLAGGSWLVAAGVARHPPRLPDALSVLDGTRDEAPIERTVAERGWLERIGASVYRRLRLPLTLRQRKALLRRQRSVGDFYAEKLIWAGLGLAAPIVVSTILVGISGGPGFVPIAAGLAGAGAGFFVPDLLLRGQARADHTDGREALFTYFDLVVLERLANRSGPQALAAAAEVSQHPVFRRIRSTLDRARLEQTSPYAHLRILADDMEFTELADIADVMRLDESGAALAGVLRARVKELRDAHLTGQRIAAQEVSERMTLPMTVPTLVFTLILFVPPLLRLLSP